MREQVKDFTSKSVTKFTVLIFIEGDDPDCIDELIGGSLKCSMDISVIQSNDIEKSGDTAFT